MRIRVTKEFKGRATKEQWIRPGDYDESDPALYGLGQTLVDEKRAVWLTDDGAEIPHGGNETPAQPVIVNQYELSDGRKVDVYAPHSTITGTSIGADGVLEITISETNEPPYPADDAAPISYSAMSAAELHAEIERRGIDVGGVKGSGKRGALTTEDMIFILEGDDSDGAG